MRLIHGDCLEVMRGMEDNSVDAVVTDPPYGLSFMGKSWDYDVPKVDIWVECLRLLKPGGHLLAFAGSRTYHRMTVNIEDAGFEIRDQIIWLYGSGFPKSHNLCNGHTGWGTALKPAHEPVCMARKPLEGTVAANVEEWGTGAINVDGCRVGHSKGRWPANVIHDGSEEVLAGFPETKSQQRVGIRSGKETGCLGRFQGQQCVVMGHDDAGSAARFFYCAKASKADRDEENNHPTVKPTDLMRYLVRMVTPKGGTVLDPFMGSGTTGKAARIEGFDFIGIEREAEYLRIAEGRINAIADRHPLFEEIAC